VTSSILGLNIAYYGNHVGMLTNQVQLSHVIIGMFFLLEQRKDLLLSL